MRVLSETYGWEPSAYLMLDDQGSPQAGFPFCLVSDVLGERIVALPFSDYCDPLVEDANSWRLLAIVSDTWEAAAGRLPPCPPAALPLQSRR